MSVLENKRVYLSLPIQHSTGAVWKDEVKRKLLENYKLKVFDPSQDVKQSLRAEVELYKKEERYEELRQVVRRFLREDLAIVDRADIVIAHVPHGVPTTGVTHEVINSNNAKKLVLLVEGSRKNDIADWYFGFIKPEFMFGTWEELYTFLNDVNDGKYVDHDRLYFMYNDPKAWL